jgi:hypothetical protein
MQLINQVTIKRHDSLANYEVDQFMQHLLSITFSSSPLLALQPCVCLGLLHGFVTVNFLGVWSLAPNSTHDLEDEGLHFIWPLPFDPSGMGGS